MVEIKVDPRVAQLVQNLQGQVANLNKALAVPNGWRLATAFHAHHNLDPLSTRFLAHALTHIAQSKSQVLQDVFVDFVLDKRGGRFLEFGATNGLDLSNTHWLETQRNWSGVLGEPARNWHEALRKNRPNSEIEQRCIWHKTGEELEFYESEIGELSTLKGFGEDDANQTARTRKGRNYSVESVALNELCDLHFGNKPLDYLSVDTEGSEWEILQSFSFDVFKPNIVTVEHNMTSSREKLFELFQAAGYVRVFENLSAFDDWYVRIDIWEACKDRLSADDL